MFDFFFNTKNIYLEPLQYACSKLKRTTKEQSLATIEEIKAPKVTKTLLDEYFVYQSRYIIGRIV